ncbi:MAG: nitroreductase family protein [Planctomycetota bacterium]|jgi:hypothetical protein
MTKFLSLSIALILVLTPVNATASEGKDIKLPEPQTTGGMPLMQALSERKTSRKFDARVPDNQTISNLLWAACGINRKPQGKRTAPTAMNWQQISVYVSMQKGLYLYDPAANKLIFKMGKDIREATGKQPFVKTAPINLIFVSEQAKMKGADQKKKDFYSATDTGFVSQNVYLYCASAGLATVVRGWLDPVALAKEMGLKEEQKVILAQSVGYPKK